MRTWSTCRHLSFGLKHGPLSSCKKQQKRFSHISLPSDVVNTALLAKRGCRILPTRSRTEGEERSLVIDLQDWDHLPPSKGKQCSTYCRRSDSNIKHIRRWWSEWGETQINGILVVDIRMKKRKLAIGQPSTRDQNLIINWILRNSPPQQLQYISQRGRENDIYW